MRKQLLAVCVLMASVLASACEEIPTGTSDPGLLDGHAQRAVSAGEAFTHIGITTPDTDALAMTVGETRPFSARLFYSAGGYLPSSPYAQWRSTDPCVATVTNTSPRWGVVTGLRAGTTRIIAEAWGSADTVTVTVSGDEDLDPGCDDRQWLWDYDDVSFTANYAKPYGVAPGEKLVRLVLFARPRPDYTIATGQKSTLRSELWYDGGGKLNGKKWVQFRSTDASVAQVTSRGGTVTGVAPGRTKIIASLGQFSDTVPLYVR
jgi:hypothetical protein